MTVWTLLVVFMTGNGITSTTINFYDKDSCEKARIDISYHYKSNWSFYSRPGICIATKVQS